MIIDFSKEYQFSNKSFLLFQTQNGSFFLVPNS